MLGIIAVTTRSRRTNDEGKFVGEHVERETLARVWMDVWPCRVDEE
jgi:hypothetical protein